MPALHPCPSCSRHVKGDAARCPFCDVALDAREHDAGGAARGALPIRLGRAARMAFGAAVATSVSVAAACSGGPGPTPDSDGGSSGTDGSSSGQDGTVIVTDGSSGSSGQDVTTIPDDAIAKPYGAPPADGLRRLV